MKTTYQGNTYQTLIDTTGDIGNSSFHIPSTDTELIQWMVDVGCIESDDEEEYDGEKYYSYSQSSWCRCSENTPEIESDGEWGYEFPNDDVDENYDYWDWRETVETLYDTNPDDYDELMYLTHFYINPDDEEFFEENLPFIKKLYTYNVCIDN